MRNHFTATEDIQCGQVYMRCGDDGVRVWDGAMDKYPHGQAHNDILKGQRCWCNPANGRLWAEHFDKLLSEPPDKFKPSLFVNDGGEIEVFWKNDPHYGKWLNHEITLYLSQETNEVVGCCLKMKGEA